MTDFCPACNNVLLNKVGLSNPDRCAVFKCLSCKRIWKENPVGRCVRCGEYSSEGICVRCEEDEKEHNPIKSKRQWRYLASQQPEVFDSWQKKYPTDYEKLPNQSLQASHYPLLLVIGIAGIFTGRFLYEEIYQKKKEGKL